MQMDWLRSLNNEFAERLSSARMPHAILLAGPRGTGKLGLARNMVSSLLCQQQTFPACGSCRSCQLLESGAHPDRQELTLEENPRTGVMRQEIIVEQVRGLISAMQLTASFSPRKVALVWPAERMNKSAANAFLKTLEEPPGQAVMVLISHEPSRLMPTIRSRCQRIDVRLPARQDALNWLQVETASEHASEELEAALDASAGRPLLAHELLQNGQVDHWRRLLEVLSELSRGGHPGAVVSELGEFDPGWLWTWLSLLTAKRLKRAATANGSGADALARLNQQADRNRQLATTPVRKDLLLQDWLIQWSELKL